MKAGIIVVVIAIIAAGIYYFYPTLYGIIPSNPNVPKLNTLQESQNNKSSQLDIPAETIIAEGLDTPWAIAFLPDGDMLVTERKGTVRKVSKKGELQPEPVGAIEGVNEVGEGGLLGIALHPDFNSNHFVYLYYTTFGDAGNSHNIVVRMVYSDNKLKDQEIILYKIASAPNHNGGRIKFGPGGFLYITTGDAQEPSMAQNLMSDAGKILRVTDTGESAPGNPFNSQVYSYGHRNPQGIAWDEEGNLFETEHGPSGGSVGTGNDEINLIQAGKNYGWPEIQGDLTREGMVSPVKNSTPSVAWAPGGAAFYNNSLFFGGLRGQALYEAVIENNKVIDFKEHFKGKYGRIREAILGPDGMLYITTSNRDGRGVPIQEDDRIIRINPAKL